MSTKQTVIFTFMILFLGVMLFAMGSWFYWSIEYSNKDRMMDALKDQEVTLNLILNGTASDPMSGVKKQIDDPEKGLKRQLNDATRIAADMKGNEAGGVVAREALYNEKEKELTGKWPVSGEKWKQLYTDWRELNKKIDQSLTTLNKQKKEKEDKVAASKDELTKELEAEDTERKKTVVERKKWADDISQTRYTHEEVQDKISSVTREVTKTTKIAPQGRVIFAAPDLYKVTIDKGAADGIRKGMQFALYSGIHQALVKKADIEVMNVKPSSSDCLILPARRIVLQDPQTGWVATDPKMKYSPWTGSGADESDAQELQKPQTKADRIEAYRQEKLEKELSVEDFERYQRERNAPTTPPVALGTGFVPILAGDWIFNPEFVPLISQPAYQKQSVDELLAMRDVNVASLTFYFTDSIPPYRQEFLKRLAERNRCKTAETMTADVNYVVTNASSTSIELLQEKLASTKDKEEVPAYIKGLRKTLAALEEGKKIGSDVIADDEMEAFFTRRQRKQELLRGKTIQPGQSIFYVAGEMKERSAAHVKRYIEDHGGVAASDLDANVDYVVAGNGLDAAFYEKIKKLGLKIIREDELPRFFGVGK